MPRVINYRQLMRVDVDISIHSCIMVLVIGVGLIAELENSYEEL